jgi:hypothetical protein
LKNNHAKQQWTNPRSHADSIYHQNDSVIMIDNVRSVLLNGQWPWWTSTLSLHPLHSHPKFQFICVCLTTSEDTFRAYPWRKSFREVMIFFFKFIFKNREKFHEKISWKKNPSNVHEIVWKVSWNCMKSFMKVHELFHEI